MQQGGVTERFSASSAAVITGVVADTAAVVALLASDTFRRWCRDYWIISAALSVALIYVVIALVEANSRKAGELSSLKERLREPSAHDRTLFSVVTTSLHPNSVTVEWLKHGFICTSFEDSLIEPLDAFERSVLRDPRGFDNEEIEAAYRDLLARVTRFTRSVGDHMWTDHPHNPNRLAIPREWQRSDPGRYQGAVDELNTRSRELVDSYDAFLLVAQRNRVTEVGVIHVNYVV
ncbi:hypothetical protein AB0G79_25965 [Streptomyces sp. NPDC020807]|uniref:hypothetical protein n=1 Tax=Streptomyces sp. NPDC020807 TaxID=3155119 RepID=UPI003409B441